MILLVKDGIRAANIDPANYGRVGSTQSIKNIESVDGIGSSGSLGSIGIIGGNGSFGSGSMRSLPAVVAELEWNNRHVLVASVHLEPFDSGEQKRQRQMELLLQLSSARGVPLIVAGDTNMRDGEDTTMEVELDFLDFWKMAGSQPESQYTWDTVDHRQENSAGTFNQYYGQRTRQYRRRYDRIYLSTTDTVSVTVPPSFGLVANHPMTSDVDFLSDHFGISARLQLLWNN